MNKQEQELRKKSPVQIRNKKASFEYFFVTPTPQASCSRAPRLSLSEGARLRSWTATATSTRGSSG